MLLQYQKFNSRKECIKFFKKIISQTLNAYKSYAKGEKKSFLDITN